MPVRNVVARVSFPGCLGCDSSKDNPGSNVCKVCEADQDIRILAQFPMLIIIRKEETE